METSDPFAQYDPREELEQAIQRQHEEVVREFRLRVVTQMENTKGKLTADMIVDAVRTLYSIQPFAYDEQRVFWLWNRREHRWRISDLQTIVNILARRLRWTGFVANSQHRRTIDNAIYLIGRDNVPKPPRKTWVQFGGTIYDLADGSIWPATHEFFLLNNIDREVGPTSDTPTMDRIVSSWVGEENLALFYEIIAYACLQAKPIHRCFCFVGGGRNGKSLAQDLITTFLGKENTTTSDINQLIGQYASRFETAKLVNKLVCTLVETDFHELTSTANLKRLTGDTLIGVERKNRDPIDVELYTKFIISTNSLPVSPDTSDGWYSRWVILDFPNRFREGVDILSTIPPEEYGCLAKKVLEVLPVLLKRGTFTNEGSIEDRRQKYIETSNPLGRFIAQTTKQEPGGFIPLSEFRAAYTSYLTGLKARIPKRFELAQALEEEGWVKEKIMRRNQWFQKGGSEAEDFNGWAYLDVVFLPKFCHQAPVFFRENALEIAGKGGVMTKKGSLMTNFDDISSTPKDPPGMVKPTIIGAVPIPFLYDFSPDDNDDKDDKEIIIFSCNLTGSRYIGKPYFCHHPQTGQLCLVSPATSAKHPTAWLARAILSALSTNTPTSREDLMERLQECDIAPWTKENIREVIGSLRTTGDLLEPRSDVFLRVG